MVRLIRSDYMNRLELNFDEACNLYDAFRCYGKCSTIETAEEMIASGGPSPLVNHWDDFDEFLNVWDLFYRMSKSCSRASFGKLLLECKVPEEVPLSKVQSALLADNERFRAQACFLLSFFDSMSDFFDYEVKMMERGYPHKSHVA